MIARIGGITAPYIVLLVIIFILLISSKYVRESDWLIIVKGLTSR